MKTRAAFELLEQRQHLSATLKDGVLTITGTRRSDHYEIYVANRSAADGFVVVVNHRKSLHFDPAKIKKIKVDLGLGNDEVSFDDTPYFVHLSAGVPVTVLGGAGNDTLTGSTRSDLLDGGDGDDGLYPQGGNNTVLGGDGNDRIDPGEDNNLLHGGGGDDFIIARAGNDTVYGDNGHDTLYGGDGDDLIMGGSGADTLDGGAGDDRIYGNRGDDSFIDVSDSPRQRRDFQPGERTFTPPPVDPIAIIPVAVAVAQRKIERVFA
jgi:Ca2+-binding RTX toxin-like protein